MGYNYQLFVYDLSSAGNERIDMQGGHVYIKAASDSSANIDVQIDSNTNDKINLTRKTGLVAKFKSIYVSWAAQAGKTITVLVTTSYEAFHVLEQSSQDVAILSSALLATGIGMNERGVTNAAEYSYNLPAGTKKFSLIVKDGDIKISKTAGEVNFGPLGADLMYLQPGDSWSEDNLNLSAPLPIYFRCNIAATGNLLFLWWT